LNDPVPVDPIQPIVKIFDDPAAGIFIENHMVRLFPW
jgi:ABC-type lipopolysaccharide export system ATPase subunit